MSTRAPKKTAKRLSFKVAVESTPDIATGFQDGLKALGKHSSTIHASAPSYLQGSVDIDACTRSKYPRDNRWDYAFAYKGEAYFVEVHSAQSSEVGVVKKKLHWLKDWLQSKAPEINQLKANEAFHWIQSGKFAILKTSPQYKAAAQIGLIPKPKLILK